MGLAGGDVTVAELIAHLQTEPQDLQVIFRCYSEYCLLEAKDIEITTQCEARPDGWVACARPDKPAQLYLTFSGN
jgi:hypothetical protein